jgi:hypothetical protein
MPTWSTTLPPEGKNHGYKLVRTPVGPSLSAIITCENILVCDTHFWHGRTTPCERIVDENGRTIDDTPCQACTQKQAWRSHCYVSAFNTKVHGHFIFECTALAAKPFAEWFTTYGTLRGCGFTATRSKPTPNSKVILYTSAANLTKIPIPNPPDVARALSVIWRLPAAALEVTEPAHRPPELQTRATVLKSLREQLDNAGDPPTAADVLRAYAARKANSHP